MHVRDPSAACDLVLRKFADEPHQQYSAVAPLQSTKRAFDADRKLDSFVVRVRFAEYLSAVDTVAV